ncbi:hypothetical protein F5J12DRAFT_899049 [Pisolithus orientalis]|uniref:uncharacterized protein n=1 Tax=Pisolithus orientalis TaxID=936130 RepID=UPI002224305F|nr:uncharacterized protein F5J12DRAFT_899049 [Pisolithus orientalis]KAI5985224.1 hypothetical protein F5J12DRAFT_899049 [Pisolithus orientalis]
MDEKMKTVDVVWELIDVMVDFYDPVEDEDPDFRYTYKEHLQGNAADKGKGKAQGEGDDGIGGGHCSGGTPKPFPHSLVVLSHAILPSRIGKDLHTPHISTALPPKDTHFANSSDMAASTSVISLVPFARDHGYIYLPGVPTSFRPEASWYILPSSAPSQHIQLGQHVLFVSMTSRRTFFGHLRSVIRLERSYVVVSVSPVQEAYGSFLPAPCNVFIPVWSIILPKLQQLQYNLLFSTLPDRIHDEYDAHLASLLQDTAEDAPPSSSLPTEPHS